MLPNTNISLIAGANLKSFTLRATCLETTGTRAGVCSTLTGKAETAGLKTASRIP